MKIKVNILNRQRKIKLPENSRKLVKDACKNTLMLEGFNQDCEVNVTFVSDSVIKRINRDFRNLDKATDVLSFPLGENGVYDINPDSNLAALGDVIISVEHAFAQADLYGHGIDREIAYLTVHSVLHLLGYDHVNNESERKIMRFREEKILKQMNLEIVKEN